MCSMAKSFLPYSLDQQILLPLPPERRKRDVPVDRHSAPAPTGATQAEQMRAKLTSSEGRALYSQRKHVVEPVFGQIKEARGFRRFSFRGLEKVTAEWDLICLTHNLLKLFRSGFSLQAA
jgi:hypothetical protein